MNQMVETVLETGQLEMLVSHNLIQEISGFEFTTTLLLPIIPDLWYNYGHRNVSLFIKPLVGTEFDWSNVA